MGKETASGDRGAGHEIVGQVERVQRLARALVRDRHMAEDLTQDVLAAALERPPSFVDQPSRLAGWLQGMTRRLAARTLGREGSRPSVEAHGARPEGEEHDFEGTLALHRQLFEGLDGLDRDARRVLVWRFLEDRSYRSIARRLGIEPTAARQRVSRALAKLRSRLDQQHKGERRAWALAWAPLLERPTAIGVGTSLELLRQQGTWIIGMKSAWIGGGVLLGGLALWAYSPWREEHRSPGRGAVVAEDSSAEVDGLGEGARSLPEAAGDGSSRLALDAVPPASTQGEAPDAWVEVVDPMGSPLSQAKVVWVDEADGWRMEPTDPDGRVQWDLPPTEIFIGLEGYDPQRLSPDMWPVRVGLEPLASLSGQLLEGDSAPAEPVLLGFERTGGPRDPWPLEALTRVMGPRDLVRTYTDSLGRFEFVGVPPQAMGWILLPTQYAYEGRQEGATRIDWDGQRVEVSLPVEDLTLRAGRLSHVEGRLRDAHGNPAASAVVTLDIGIVDRELPLRIVRRADSDGHFLMGIPPRPGDPVPAHEVENVRVTVSAGASWSETIHNLPVVPSTRWAELGTLDLEASRSVVVKVVDAMGGPIDRAHAVAGGLMGPRGVRIIDPRRDPPIGAFPSGEGVAEGGRPASSGQGLFEFKGMPPGTIEVIAGALGYRVVEVEIPPGSWDLENPFVVELPQGPTLAVELQHPSGEVPLETEVSLHGRRDRVFEDGSLPPAVAAFGFMGTGSNPVEFNLDVPLDSDGRGRVGGIPPGVPLGVTIYSRHGAKLLEATLEPLGIEEERTEVLRIETLEFGIRGSVRSAAGEPIARARVALLGEAGGYSTTTNRDGRFGIGGYQREGALVKATVVREGFVALIRRDVELSSTMGALDFELEEGRRLEGVVVDRGGAPLEGVQLRWLSEGHLTLEATTDGDGRFEVHDLSRGPVEVEASFEGELRSYQLEAWVQTVEFSFE